MILEQAAGAARRAVIVHVRGVVQGVGFRPFVHRLAVRHSLSGWVRNEAGEVRIAVEGNPEEVDDFLLALEREAPPLASLDSVHVEPDSGQQHDGFRIVDSDVSPVDRLPVSPDVSMCAACERELLDPSNRRYRYPFITCTDCGPRYTVIESMPYDRERTTMRAFTQCRDCRAEYEDPADRRYHSETNCCPICGPGLWLVGAGQRNGNERADPVASAARLLRTGLVIAVRGLGGFHLAADATDDSAVRRLRARKRREAKPLAVMVRDLDEARSIAHVTAVEAQLLTSRERPIVLLEARADGCLAPSVAPALDAIGVMLPYTPLHRLLLEEVGRPLVMTSGNLSDEPIATGNEEAFQRLSRVADAFLLHNREIAARYDDSVVRVAAGAPRFIRRARGYAPLPIALPVPTPVPLLAVGPHLKNTFTLAHDTSAYVSQHIGDLDHLETLEHFETTLSAWQTLFRIEPQVAVRDLHPEYLSSRFAAGLGLPRVISVQHHHAHVAAVMAEHGVTQRVVGLAFDGTGYGDDGTVWGAETLVADLGGYERVGSLRSAPLAGGDLAARQPWRVALGYLSLEPDAAPAFARAFEGIEADERSVAERQIAARLNTPIASSMGRLFDAAAAVLGLRRVARYEGQAAMELEALAGRRPASPLPFPVLEDGQGRWVMDPLPLLIALGEGVARGSDPAILAAQFHASVARAAAQISLRALEGAGLDTVVLGGGVFQNARLLTSVVRSLEDEHVRVLTPLRLSANDGAISYGQAAVAAWQLHQEVASCV